MCYARRSIVDGLTVPSNKLSQRYAAWGLFHRVFGYSLQKSALPIFFAHKIFLYLSRNNDNLSRFEAVTLGGPKI